MTKAQSVKMDVIQTIWKDVKVDQFQVPYILNAKTKLSQSEGSSDLNQRKSYLSNMNSFGVK
jgi:hypothetical protein